MRVLLPTHDSMCRVVGASPWDAEHILRTVCVVSRHMTCSHCAALTRLMPVSFPSSFPVLASRRCVFVVGRAPPTQVGKHWVGRFSVDRNLTHQCPSDMVAYLSDPSRNERRLGLLRGLQVHGLERLKMWANPGRQNGSQLTKAPLVGPHPDHLGSQNKMCSRFLFQPRFPQFYTLDKAEKI